MKRVILIAVLVAAGLFPVTAKGTDYQPCKGWGVCKTRLNLERTAERWVSPEVFRASHGARAVVTQLHIDGRIENFEWVGCRGEYNGRRIVLRASTCGKSTTLRVRGVTMVGKAALRLTYGGSYG